MWLHIVYANTTSTAGSSGSFWEIKIGSVIVILLLLYFEILRPYLRRTWHLRKAFVCHFAVDDNNDNRHLVDKLVLPANRQQPIALRIWPKINYKQTDLLVNIGSQMEDKPEILNYYNAFVSRGKGRFESPETNDRHYVDRKGAYHITNEKMTTKPNTFTVGYSVRTKTAGCYPLRIAAVTDDGEALPKNECFILVEEEPSTRMKCFKHEDCYIDPKEIENLV